MRKILNKAKSRARQEARPIGSQIARASRRGLIPTIIQDINTKQVLMLGYSNQQSIAKTKKTKKITFYSRSKKRLWTKGETSKNYLRFKKMQWDCDKDTILMLADPAGPTCHKNNSKNYSCFQADPDFSLNLLEEILTSRRNSQPKKSYTAKLLKDEQLIKAKILEEAIEVIEETGKQRLVEESADVIYHLMVLWQKKNISLDDIEKELKKRNS